MIEIAAPYKPVASKDFNQTDWTIANRLPKDIEDGGCAALTAFWLACYRHTEKQTLAKRTFMLQTHYEPPSPWERLHYDAEDRPGTLGAQLRTLQIEYEASKSVKHYGVNHSPAQQVFASGMTKFSGRPELDFSRDVTDHGEHTVADIVEGFFSGTGRSLYFIGYDHHAYGVVHDPTFQNPKYPNGKYKFFDANHGIASFSELANFQKFFVAYFDSFNVISGGDSLKDFVGSSFDALTNWASSLGRQSSTDPARTGPTLELYSTNIPVYRVA